MRTQCTICLSSHHTKRSPEQPPSILLSSQSVERSSSDQTNELASSLGARLLLLAVVFASLPLRGLRLSDAPRQLPFLSLLFFSHFLPLDPDSSSVKIGMLLTSLPRPLFLFLPSRSIQTNSPPIYIPAFWFSLLILCSAVQFQMYMSEP